MIRLVSRRAGSGQGLAVASVATELSAGCGVSLESILGGGLTDRGDLLADGRRDAFVAAGAEGVRVGQIDRLRVIGILAAIDCHHFSGYTAADRTG